MGPVALFDKSFLQSLSVDESVWFDHFFLVNVCPIFYGETLADLDKTVRESRTPEQEVGIIADKFPEKRAFPCVYHRDLCRDELLSGCSVPMTGQVPMRGGRRVESECGKAAVFESSPEADAFQRWQRREFLEIEHRYARAWRRNAAILDLAAAATAVKDLGITERCKNLEQAKLLAAKAVHKEKPFVWISRTLNSLGISEGLRQQTLKRWVKSGKSPLFRFAPYTAFVSEVEMFFRVALTSQLISSERPSNQIDVSYLFYLPFCMMFVSSDRLHRRCAPLFLRPNQEFVWGPDLKTNLGEINEHYLGLPKSTREEGIYSFAEEPPPIGNQAVRNLWTRLLPNWQDADREYPDAMHRRTPTVGEIKKLAESPEMVIRQSDSVSGELDQVVIKRSIKRKKGSWYQIPDHNEPT